MSFRTPSQKVLESDQYINICLNRTNPSLKTIIVNMADQGITAESGIGEEYVDLFKFFWKIVRNNRVNFF